MKRKYLAVCSGVLCLLLTGCGSSTTTTTEDTVPQSNQLAQTTSSDVRKDKGTIGSYAVSIKSASIGKSYDGKTAVIITYDFTNNHTEAASFMFAIHDTVYQNGIQLESTIMSGDNDNMSKNVKTGATLEVQRAYILQDTTSPVEVEIAEAFSFNNDKITKTFELK